MNTTIDLTDFRLASGSHDPTAGEACAAELVAYVAGDSAWISIGVAGVLVVQWWSLLRAALGQKAIWRGRAYTAQS